MAAISDLTDLLHSMQPDLHGEPYGIAAAPPGFAAPGGFVRIAEAEALTVIAPLVELDQMGLTSPQPWARISLTVHSDLAAVGLTAAIAGALAEKGISANVVAGFYHDHIFVPWPRRHDALLALKDLSHA